MSREPDSVRDRQATSVSIQRHTCTVDGQGSARRVGRSLQSLATSSPVITPSSTVDCQDVRRVEVKECAGEYGSRLATERTAWRRVRGATSASRALGSLSLSLCSPRAAHRLRLLLWPCLSDARLPAPCSRCLCSLLSTPSPHRLKGPMCGTQRKRKKETCQVPSDRSIGRARDHSDRLLSLASLALQLQAALFSGDGGGSDCCVRPTRSSIFPSNSLHHLCLLIAFSLT